MKVTVERTTIKAYVLTLTENEAADLQGLIEYLLEERITMSDSLDAAVFREELAESIGRTLEEAYNADKEKDDEGND